MAADSILREIHLATSTDKGLTWKYEGPICSTADTPGTRRKGAAGFSGSHYDGGDGDHLLYVDERGGYIYIFTDHYAWPKSRRRMPAFMRHCVARCADRRQDGPGKVVEVLPRRLGTARHRRQSLLCERLQRNLQHLPQEISVASTI